MQTRLVRHWRPRARLALLLSVALCLTVASCLLAACGVNNGSAASPVAGAGSPSATPAGGPGAAPSAAPSATPGGAAARDVTLTVGLFPWVPRLRQFETVIATAWEKRHPGIALEFVLWDCYSSDPPRDLDLFVFDAVFRDYFQQRGYLQPLAENELERPADVLPYALQAARAGGTLSGIPQLGCASLLFYRRGDGALEAARDLGDVVAALGEGAYAGLKPPPGKGLLVDLSDPTADACLYVEALVDTYGAYSADPPLAPDAGRLDPWAVDNVRALLNMASRRQARYVSDDQFRRAAWFARGFGRAYIGYSESLALMGEASQSEVAFKLMPMSQRANVPLFYVDLIGVNRALGVGPERALAVELANLMASTDVLVEAMGPWRGDASPQYLFPVRRSVFRALEQRFPLYSEMEKLSAGAETRPFLLGAESRRWFRTMGPAIRRQVFATP